MSNKIPLILISLVLLASCHHNRLKINEKVLREEIALQGKKEQDNQLNYNGAGDTMRHVKSLRYKEDRSVDRAHLPVVIDIEGNLGNIRDLKLSDVASEIQYVRMQPVPDTTIPSDLKFSYHLTDNYIIASNLYGIHLYTKDGRYLRPVVKNEMTGVIIRPGAIMFYTDYTLKGGGIDVRSSGDDIFYYYSNTMTGEKYIMRYDCSSMPVNGDYRFDPENPDRISGLGDAVLDLNHGKPEPPAPRTHQGMFGGSPEWLHYSAFGAFIFDKNSYALPADDNGILTIRNGQGDTLSSFSRFEKVVNYSKSMKRGTDYDREYEYQGKLHIRPEFNDTVFRAEPPNRLYPVYVLRLGRFKASMQEGVDPDFDLKGRIIPGEWAETDKFIFLTFTKDSYDCPNTRKNRTVKIYHALYSKATGIFEVIKGDPFDYSAEILENDIDGGVPVWPSFYMMGNNSEILYSLKGKELKQRVESANFRRSSALAARKKVIEMLAASASDKDDILMIIK